MSAAENAQSAKVLEELMKQLTISKDEAATKEASAALASFMNGRIEDQDVPTKSIEALQKNLANKKDAAAREKACIAITAIASHAEVSAHVEPFLIELLPAVFAAAGDKAAPVKNAAAAAVLAIADAINANAVKVALPAAMNSISNAQKWQEKNSALEFLEALVKSAPVQMSFQVPDLIPVISGAMWDTKKEVKARAHTAMEKLCSLISNKDIEKFIPALIDCIAKPELVPETVHTLGATTFVTEVREPTLALMVPLLERGFVERETAIKRKSAVIVDNMCKLVDDPNIVAPFLPKMMPALTKNFETMADPEAREKTKQALDTLTRVGAVKDGKIPEVRRDSDVDAVLPKVKAAVPAKHAALAEKLGPVVKYIAAIAGQLVDDRENNLSAWANSLKPFATVIVGDADAEAFVESIRRTASPDAAAEDDVLEEEEEGEDLCNCEFSLAYGAKTLLNKTWLHLKRGKRYGLCGPNGSGKSTLLRSIHEGKVEGFPSKDEVKTVFVEHDLDSADTELKTIEWTMKKLEEAHVDVTEAEVMARLLEFGFSDEMIKAEISSLSGGWKMKLALCRAVFEDPDILLLDEPTNHLDTVNVRWLEEYLKASKCTSIIVSHDSGFLDNVCQYIINYERFKLKKYRGNLSAFVEKCPSAKSYFELSASEMEFSFPEPGFLEGVKTKSKAILRADKMSFQYPGSSKAQLEDISFQCSLGSRIAVIGPNGAGKSTLVNVLTGELIATGGEVWQHENLRIAYIKQHAFAHIDNHLTKTPSEYIQWRFQTGEDRETMDRANKIITEDDETGMKKIFKVNDSQRRVISILSRRKFKNSYEYECSFSLGENVGQKGEKWTPMMTADNEWLPRSELLASHAKMVAEVDNKEALKSGQIRPLVRRQIEEHCAMFGLDAELVSHSRMRGLSGGQRVKVVLAACSWQRPHLIVLDEPTNYLDRDSLGALSKALKKFEGGVIIITHSAEFTKDLTEEVWAVQAGRMTPSGHNWEKGQGSGPKLKTNEEEGDTKDALGNVVKNEKKAKISSNEARKKKKERMARRKRGEEVFTDEE